MISKENKKIKNATKNKFEGISFKSKLERSIYSTLKQMNINVEYEPKTFVLYEGFEPITPFYDRETKTKQLKRIAKGDSVTSRILELKTAKVIGIRYTPDFFFKYGNLNVYIEGKGKENEVYYIKKKLFRKYLDDELKNNNIHSIFFEIYTLKQLSQALKIIKEYEQTLVENNKKS